jgi:rhodanese-related sulfurtransferase
MKKCGVEHLEKVLQNKIDGQVIDVREPAEFNSEHIEGTTSLPLSILNEDRIKPLKKDVPVYLLCRSGGRACSAADKLEKFGFKDIHVIDGGMQAWIAAGKKVTYGLRSVWSIDRQVRFAAGSLVLTGILFSFFIHPYWIALSAFVGAGLVFSGVTDTCGMAMLLLRMPWNKKRS